MKPPIQSLQIYPFYFIFLRAQYEKYGEKIQKLPMELINVTFFYYDSIFLFYLKDCFLL